MCVYLCVCLCIFESFLFLLDKYHDFNFRTNRSKLNRKRHHLSIDSKRNGWVKKKKKKLEQSWPTMYSLKIEIKPIAAGIEIVVDLLGYTEA